MKNEITRKEAAGILKVSVPTFRKFIHEHRQAITDNRVNLQKLIEIITKESEFALRKQG